MKNKFNLLLCFLYKDTGHPGQHIAELHIYKIELHAEKKKDTSVLPSLLYMIPFF